jgi:hypothetical protein
MELWVYKITQTNNIMVLKTVQYIQLHLILLAAQDCCSAEYSKVNTSRGGGGAIHDDSASCDRGTQD